ncbi:MAG: alpha/beta hydrolase [Clostridia bacterium]|nr:alpha/beta hydrolase [Clostridia bacterium]
MQFGRGLVTPRKVVLIDSAGLKPKRSFSYYTKVGFFKTGKFFLNLLPNISKVKEFKEKLLNKVGSSDYKASPTVLKETMKIIVNEDSTKLLPNIKAPTLLIWGTLDTATPLSDALKMEKLIPDCGLVKYVSGSHFAYLENIQNVNAVLNEFFKNDISSK